ncbi:MAG: glycoside hydrolase family 88 protein [Planctomycetota bacterium]|nr:glycoside hydrolase family 88 protein [Planctomycetota bacterium]
MLPTRRSIDELLHRILTFADGTMPARVIDRRTQKEITDFSAPNPNAMVDRGPRNAYYPFGYTQGVTHAGMLLAAEVTGDSKFADFTARQLQFIHDRIDYFKAMPPGTGVGPARNGFYPILNPDSLDASGAMCAALLKARRANVGPDLMPVIDRWINYIHTKQFRLSDGTLARTRPQKESLWGDDLYMSVPALAQMGKLTGDHQYFDDAIKQVKQFNGYLFDPQKGIYMHGRSMNQPDNPEFCWGRANGWAMMASVELLDVLPEDYAGRDDVLKILRAHIKGVVPLQSGSGLWHQLLDKPDSYLETSASAMFVYSIARSINRGWISPVDYGSAAQAAWNGITTRVNERGQIEGTCVGTTLASDAVYYYNRPTTVGDAHGFGPVLLAGAEMIRLLENPKIDIQNKDGTFYYVPKDQ